MAKRRLKRRGQGSGPRANEPAQSNVRQDFKRILHRPAARISEVRHGRS